MIDLHKSEFLKLRQVQNEIFAGAVHPLLVEDERIITSYQSVRDGVVFTDRRVFFVVPKGLSGRRQDITALPYRSIRAFSHLQTALDVDREVLLDVEGGGSVKLNFLPYVDTAWLCRLLGQYLL